MLAPDGEVPERLLGIFVKEPIAGRVKTRLSPPLTPEDAARLYTVAMRETISRFTASGLPVALFYDGSERYFRENFPTLPLWRQSGSDLGQRMHSALAVLLDTGCRTAALIGSDSPDLPVAQVEAAFALLAAHELVTIPAADGGYVLIGQSAPCPPVFEAIPWSTGEVLAMTRQRAEELGLSYRESGGWSDIDDHRSLEEIVRRSPGSDTARYIRENLSGYLSTGRV